MPSVETRKNDENYDLYDTENEEYQRQLLRPAEIKEDVKLMGHCQRVSRILHSEAFHRELNKILNQQFDEGAACGGLAGSASEANAAAALQEISNFLHPQARLGCSVFNRGATMPIIPINDLKITDKNISKPEKLLRCKLASVYRLIDLHGWANGMMLHASVRINRDADEFLTNCHGLMNHEITANNLVKVNLKGEVNNLYGRIDLASWVLHASIHQADPVFKCVVHVRTPAVVAVSCMRSGLIKISEEAVKLGDVPVYEWGSASVNVEPGERLSVEQSELTHVIGDKKCILVRNQGLLARGKTVEEAWNIAGLAVHACETQVRLASSVGSANLMLAIEPSTESEIDEHSTELQFESLMRALDAAGHRTGYLYKHALVVVDRKRRLHEQQHQQEDGHMADMEDEDEDVEIPPSSTSFATRTEAGDEPVKQRQPQTQWLLHTPNDYVREEITENGTRKVVSWRPVSAESRQTSGLVETCTSPNQFAPQGHDKHELKHQQQKVKGKYFRDETSAGHQSRVLRNVDQTSEVDGLPEEDTVGRVVLVGAVSRGIIDKKHRHDPSVYQSCFSPNPFDRVTDDDLKQYKRRVMGLPSDEVETSKQEVSLTEPSLTDTNISSPVDKPTIVEPTPQPEENEEEIIIPSPSQQEMHAEPPAAPINTTTPSLTVSTAIRSDTSGADLSHDDTEREGHKSGSGGKKKKKKLKEMFSFRKSKDKSK